MPPEALKRKSGEEETHEMSTEPQDTLILEPKRRKANVDSEDADKEGKVSTKNAFWRQRGQHILTTS